MYIRMIKERKQPDIWSQRYAALVQRPWQLGFCCLVCGVALLFLGVALGGGTREHIVPVGTLVAGTIAAFVALGQLQVTRQRHEEQTKADLRRRITESFAKAVEQLGSDKLEVRLGGIYTLERIAHESADDYWPTMETLTAFVRERTRWKESDDNAVSGTVSRFYRSEPTQQFERGAPTDIAAVLTVINRRFSEDRIREADAGWRFDLRGVDFRHFVLRNAHLGRVFLTGAHLEGAFLNNAHLEEAILTNAHLEGAHLADAHLEKASLVGACLEGAYLADAHLEGAYLDNAHLSEVFFSGAHLNGAFLRGAHLNGVDLSRAIGVTQDQLDHSNGNEATVLPEGLDRPVRWMRVSK